MYSKSSQPDARAFEAADFARTAKRIVAQSAAILRAFCRAIAARLRAHHTSSSLSGLSDRTLKDIGLSRSEIFRVAYVDGGKRPDPIRIRA